MTPDPKSPYLSRGVLGWFVRLAWLGPAALAVLFIAFLGGLLWFMQNRALRRDHNDLVASAATAATNIQQRLTASRDYLEMLAEDMARGAVEADLFQRRLSQYIADHPELVNVFYVEENMTIRRRAPSTIGWKAGTVQLASLESRQAFQSARATRRSVYSRPLVTPQGEAAFEVHAPVFTKDRFAGALVGVYSCRRLLRHMLQREILHEHHVSLLDGDESTTAALPATSRVDERLIKVVRLDPPGRGVALRLARYGSGFWGVGLTLLTVLCVGLVVGMAWGLWSLNRHIARRAEAEQSLRQARDELARRVRERTAELEAANKKLKQEMSERQRAEQSARQRQEELAHVARVSTMGEMAAGLAHELNQPLGAIATFAEGGVRLMEAGKPKPEDLRMLLDEVSEQARRAGQIIHRLRAFVAKGEPRKSAASVGELCDEVVDLLAMDIRQNQVELHRDIQDDLPLVTVDRIQIQQVLLNLMRNALEAMAKQPAGRRRLTVRGCVVEDGTVEVAVRDSGPPCPPESLEQLFEAFYTTKNSGIGMGLPISRSIIETHGGRLWVERNPDRGLTFRFTLPAGEEQADEANEQC